MEPIPPGTFCDDPYFCNGADSCDDNGSCAIHPRMFCGRRACEERSDQCGVGMEPISAGTFTMGSPGTEAGRQGDESQHEVTFTRDFWILSTEVTQAEFQALMNGWNPDYLWPCADCPVGHLSWYDAAAYADALTLQHGGTPCYLFSDVRCRGGLAAVDQGCPRPIKRRRDRGINLLPVRMAR